MQTLMMDLRFGLRQSRLNPLYASTAIVILAMGVAANTVIFSVADALVFRPLPFPEESRLVRITAGNGELKLRGPASHADYLAWKNQSRLMEGPAWRATRVEPLIALHHE